MGPIGTRELIILLVVAMILFGSKRLPQAARSLGQSMRILKAETKGLRDDDATDHVVPPPVIPPAPQAYGNQATQAQTPQAQTTPAQGSPSVPHTAPPAEQPGAAGDGPR